MLEGSAGTKEHRSPAEPSGHPAGHELVDELQRRDLVRPDAELLDAAERAALSPQDLVLEFSERDADADPDRFAERLERLRHRGFSIALDDIGTGHVGHTVLERVRPDFLKLDRSLVREIDRNLIKQELLHSLVRIAGRIGADVIAEGVETEAEATTLKQAGTRYGQGFLFAEPAPAPGKREH